MNALLHTEGLSVGHGRTPLLEDVELQLVRGEIVALIGVNGSGKSTLLRTLTGLLPPLAGRVLMEGVPIHAMNAIERARRVGVVLTARNQVGLLDVRTLVALGRQPWTGHLGRLRAADVEQVDRAMEETGIIGLADRGMHALSDGERQKVMIARVLAQETPLLVLDEPTAFLDLVNRVQVVRLMRDIAHRGNRSVLLSTHDLRTALDLADRIALVHQGRLWCGTPADAISTDVLANAFQGDGLQFDPDSGTLR